MTLERRLQITLTLLVSLGALMLGLGRRDPWLPVLAIVAACASLYGTDVRGVLKLNRWVANAIAVICVSYCLWNFVHVDQETQLLSIADLLIYLEVILLFQEKNERVYWHVSILSLLQIVVGSAMTASLMFGLLMGLYAAVGLVFLWLLHWYRAENVAAWRAAQAKPVRPSGSFLRATAPAPTAGRCALPAAPVLISWFVGAWALSALLFLLIPRVGQTATGDLGQVALRATGFSETVKLGALGDTIQNGEVVMRISFTDPHTKGVYPVDGSPLFRGSILTHYESPGVWSDPPAPDVDRLTKDFLPNSTPEYVVQHVELAPLRDSIAFSVFPPVFQGRPEPLFFQSDRLRLVHIQEAHKEVHYALGTLGIYNNRPRTVVPMLETVDRAKGAYLRQLPPLNDQGQDRLAELKVAALNVVGRAGAKADDRFGRAQALESWLRDSGRFSYSLKGQDRDPKLDPIEDFVSKHRVGHCEYFASALCLMLRSLDIPARVVVGFRSEWNPLTGDYVARQLDAHAWVEAYLEPSQIPPAELAGWPPGAAKKGGWMILDPTPGSGDGTLSSSLWPKWWRDSLDYAQQLWGRYVISMNAATQRESIYGWVGAAVRRCWQFFTTDIPRYALLMWEGIAALAGPLAPYLVLFGFGALAWIGFRLASWRGGRGWPALRPAARKSSPAGTKIDRRRSFEIAFFRRYERLWQRLGAARRPTQTQWEFALQTASARLSGAALEPLRRQSERLVELYYRVRFGGRALDKAEAEAVEHALQELETWAARKR